MEYELKFKIKRKNDILPKLVRFGAKDLGKRKETDISIGAKGQGLRIRKFGRGGLVTHKNMVSRNVRAKVRQEIQTEVSNIDNMIEMFRIVGFPEKKRREKIRHTFRMGDVLVLIDRLPFLGYFVEIEACSNTALKKAVKKLGFDPAKGSCESYDNIFLNYYIINARKFKDSKVTILPTFASESGFRRR